MIVEVEAESFIFGELTVDADQLLIAVNDPENFYRFNNDGNGMVTVEKFRLKDLRASLERLDDGNSPR